MDYWWKENKRFVMTVGGIALAALLYQGLVLSRINTGTEAMKRALASEARLYEMRTLQGVPADDSVRRAEEDRVRLVRDLAALHKDVALSVEEKLRPSSGRDLQEAWHQLKVDVHKDLSEKAAGHKLAFPASMGWGDDHAKLTPEMCRELLKRLAIAKRLCEAAMEVGVEALTSINMIYGVDDRRAQDDRARYLTRLHVEIRFKATSESLFKLVHEVQKRERFLGIEVLEAARESGQDLFAVRLVACGLDVDEKAPLGLKAEDRP